jgi:hypothetical protein
VKKQAAKTEWYDGRYVRMLDCFAGDLKVNGQRRACVFQCISKEGQWDIEQQAFPVEDGREIVVKTLMALAYDDPFARQVLEECFAKNKLGEFAWPSGPF